MDIKEKIIFPLDVSSVELAKDLVIKLRDHVGMFKIGLELFISTSNIINLMNGRKIFLDLKLHDIPITINRTMKVISKLSINMTTVHCSGGKDMLKAAVDGASGKIKIIGVTILTSDNNIDNLLYYADMAKSCGCDGIVCSGHEVKLIKQNFGKEFLVVTPGIRPNWYIDNNDDQKRITTPYDAIINGSDYLVIGRPIRNNINKFDAINKIINEIKDKG